jgi:hypothetical protein
MLTHRLAQAQRRLADSDQRVRRQINLVCEAIRRGDESTLASQILREFQRVRALRIAECERLRAEIKLRTSSMRKTRAQPGITRPRDADPRLGLPDTA